MHRSIVDHRARYALAGDGGDLSRGGDSKFRIVVAAAALVVSAACGFVDETQPGAIVVCASDGDCPHGDVCIAARHECAAPGSDAHPPGVVDVRFDPPAVSDGASTLTITADEEQGDDPVVTF